MSRKLRGSLAAAMALAVIAVLPVLADEAQNNNVVVTKPGVVFHKAGSSDIRGRAVEKTVDSALESGYAPCPVCFAKELSAARGTNATSGGAAPSVSAGDSLPTPPVVTVSQPFGVRYQTRPRHNGKAEGIQDPYADRATYIPGRSEQGAYGER